MYQNTCEYNSDVMGRRSQLLTIRIVFISDSKDKEGLEQKQMPCGKNGQIGKALMLIQYILLIQSRESTHNNSASTVWYIIFTDGIDDETEYVCTMVMVLVPYSEI